LARPAELVTRTPLTTNGVNAGAPEG
jgi:hypothetical protein